MSTHSIDGLDLGRPLDVFPFFVGSGRSGTTLLQMIFDSHSELAVAHESVFVGRLGRRRGRYRRRGGFATDLLVRDLFADWNFHRLGFAEGDIRALLSDPPVATFPAAVRRIFGLYAQRAGKPRYGDKTPGHVRRIELLADMFPEARFIHVIRDGRNAALGFQGKSWGPNGYAETALHWAREVSAGRASGESLGSLRYTEVRYEDLVERSEEVVRGLCEFVGVEFEASMLKYYERGEAMLATTARPNAHRRLLLPPTAGLRDWRKEMPADGAAVFEALAGSVLRDLGYETIHDVSIPLRLEAAYQWVRWQGKRARARLGMGPRGEGAEAPPPLDHSG